MCVSSVTCEWAMPQRLVFAQARSCLGPKGLVAVVVCLSSDIRHGEQWAASASDCGASTGAHVQSCKRIALISWWRLPEGCLKIPEGAWEWPKAPRSVPEREWRGSEASIQFLGGGGAKAWLRVELLLQLQLNFQVDSRRPQVLYPKELQTDICAASYSFQSQIQNRAASRINLQDRDRSEGILADNPSLQLHILLWIPIHSHCIYRVLALNELIL